MPYVYGVSLPHLMSMRHIPHPNETKMMNDNTPTPEKETLPSLAPAPTAVSGRERLRDAGFLREQWQNLRLIWRLIRDPQVPIYLKIIPAAAVFYLFLPIDLVPDFMLGLGQMDDLALLIAGAKTFTTLAPQHIVAAHLQEIRREDGLLPAQSLEDTIIIEGERKK